MLNSPTPEESLELQRKVKFAAFLKRFFRLQISASKPETQPDPIIAINGCSVATAGNIIVVSGAPKSAKSSLIYIFLAEAIKIIGTIIDGLTGLYVAENSFGRAVIHIDSEQSRSQHYKSFINGILKRAGLVMEPEYFLSFNIRELDVKIYQKIVREIFKAAFERFGGIHLAVIDGGADFIASVNDEVSSNAIVHFFETLAIEFNTAIVIIIHLNPGGDKQRGHLGSQLQRKAESVLVVKRNGSISHIEPQFLRGADSSEMPQIQFQFDKAKGYHVSCGFLIKTSKEDQNTSQLKDWAKQAFPATPISHKVAVGELMRISGLSERSVKTKIKEMLDQNILEKTGKLYILKNSDSEISDTEDDE